MNVSLMVTIIATMKESSHYYYILFYFKSFSFEVFFLFSPGQFISSSYISILNTTEDNRKFNKKFEKTF